MQRQSGIQYDITICTQSVSSLYHIKINEPANSLVRKRDIEKESMCEREREREREREKEREREREKEREREREKERETERKREI